MWYFILHPKKAIKNWLFKVNREYEDKRDEEILNRYKF
jgi:hypothetical protein